MRAAILDAAQFGRTSGMAAEIVRCRQINATLGTNLTPWELAQAPDEWLTAVEMWGEELPKAQAWVKETQAGLARLREKNERRQ
jgi:hypothetical protein